MDMVSATIDKLGNNYVDDTKYMSDEEFAKISGVTPATVRQQCKSKGIPGGVVINDEYLFWPGSRYPYKVGCHKLETYEDRCYVLLKAIYKGKYISHAELRMEKTRFDNLLKDYLVGGLIKLNSSRNPFGANAYDITEEGIAFLERLDSKKREKREALIDEFFKRAKQIKELIPNITIKHEE